MIDASRLKRVELIAQTSEVIVVNKPCGVAIHGGAQQSGRTLIEILRAASEQADAIFPVHRLDRATSGLVIFAKSAEKAKALQREWAEVQKTYLALVFGHWSGPETLSIPIDGKPASTKVIGVECSRGDQVSSVLTLRLETGRNHQIRRHLQSAGFAIAFDDKYGDFQANKAFRRQLQSQGLSISRKAMFLHAYALKSVEQKSPWIAPPPRVWFECLQTFTDLDPDLVLKPKLI